MNIDELKQLVGQGLSQKNIAKILGVTQKKICYALKEFGLKARRTTLKESRKPGNCECCGDIITGKHAWKAKYCSTKCQMNKELKDRISSGDYSVRTAKRYLIELDRSCSVCRNTEWNQKPIPLEIDHIDGNSDNNSLDNLRLLCPNCHAQTETYKNKNMGNGRYYRRARYKDGKSF